MGDGLYDDHATERKINRASVDIGQDSNLRVTMYDSSGNETGDGAAASVSDGTQTVATAGSAVQLSATSVPCKRVFIQALDNNSGNIVIGASTVVAAQGTRRGALLFPSQGMWCYVGDLNLLYIDSTSRS